MGFRIARSLVTSIFGLGLFLSACGYIQAGEAELFETPSVSAGGFTVKAGEKPYSLVLGDGWRYVKTAYVTAEAYREKAVVEVIVNGVIKRTLVIPPNDPNYQVDVDETAHSIEFRNVSGGEVRVSEVRVCMSTRVVGTDDTDDDQNDDEATPQDVPRRYEFSAKPIAQLSQDIIDRLNSIERDVDLREDFVAYFLPIRTLADRTKAFAEGQSGVSRDTRRSLKALIRQIDYADPAIARVLRTGSVRERGRDLLRLKHVGGRILMAFE